MLSGVINTFHDDLVMTKGDFEERLFLDSLPFDSSAIDAARFLHGATPTSKALVIACYHYF